MLDAVLEFSEFSASESGSESSSVYPQPPVGGKSIIVFPAALLSLADPERHSLGSRFHAPHRVLFHSGLVFRPHCELPSVHYSVCWMSLLLVRQYTFSLPRTYQYQVSFPHLFLFFSPSLHRPSSFTIRRPKYACIHRKSVCRHLQLLCETRGCSFSSFRGKCYAYACHRDPTIHHSLRI